MLGSKFLLAAAVALAVAPAVAYAGPLDGIAVTDIHDTSSGGYVVKGACTAVVGTSTKFNQITYTVRGSADAVVPPVPLSTVVWCVVYNAATRRVYGVVSGGLPGSHAEAVRQVDVPTSATVAVCVEGGANYLDGFGLGLDGHCPD
jgi:hypothetical protein